MRPACLNQLVYAFCPMKGAWGSKSLAESCLVNIKSKYKGDE